MPVFDLYHKRQKRLRGDVPDVYIYDELPTPFRVQVIHIVHEVLGPHHECCGDYRKDSVCHAYWSIVSVLRKELGVFVLPPRKRYESADDLTELTNFMIHVKDHEQFLSAVELICRLIENVCSKYDYRCRANAESESKGAIEEINARFREHGLGYEYNGQIIRIDAQYIHAEAVRPALMLLTEPSYQGAQDEFLRAHEHYRKGDHKEALNEALKSLESVLKTICGKRGWPHAPTDTASRLIKACFDNGLLPTFWEAQFSALRSALESGVPTARNKLGGHGQGMTPISVPEHLTSYVLHMTASAIVFLVRAEKVLP